jgi:malonate decarboxylase gamma subunit
MTLDEILEGLFPSGHDAKTSPEGVITGAGKRKNGQAIAVIGVANGAPLARLRGFVVGRAGFTNFLAS